MARKRSSEPAAWFLLWRFIITFLKAPSILSWAVRVLAMLGGMALASTGECRWVFLVLFGAGFVLGFQMERWPRAGSVLSVLQPVLALLALFISLVDFFLLSKSFLLSVAHFLLMLQSLQLLILRTPRENLGAILLSSLMVLSSSTLAVEWTFFMFLVIYLPALIWTLMLHTLVVENASVADGVIQTNIIGKTVIMRLRKSMGLAVLSAVLCCTVVFVFFPRFNFQGFRGQFLQPVKKTGFTNQVNLGGERSIAEDNTIVMRIELAASDRHRWPGYIRGGTLESFDGRTWKRAPYTPERHFRSSAGAIQTSLKVKANSLLRQKIYLESIDSSLLFAVGRPISFDINRMLLESFPDGSVQRAYGDSWRLHYEVESNLDLPLSLSATSFSSEFSKERYPQIVDLARRVIGSASDPWAQAQRLNSFFSQGFEYSLQSEILSSDPNPTETFLFTTKKGHCEYFASALCLMLRSIGIPARVVTGFFSNEWNERGQYIIVRSRHAHAWVEFYKGRDGWMMIDPTPADGRSGDEFKTFAPRWAQIWDDINLKWNRYILSYDIDQQKSLFEAVTRQSSDWSFRMGGLLDRLRGTVLSVVAADQPIRKFDSFQARLLWGVALPIVIFILWALKLKKRADKTLWFYKPFLSYLQTKGPEKSASQTLSEYISQIGSKLDPVRSDVDFLLKSYYLYRFQKKNHLSVDETAKIRLVLTRLK